MTYSLALDVGATKVAYGFVADSDPLTVTAAGAIPTQPDPDRFGARQAAEQIARAVEEALKSADAPRRAEVMRVGIGAPGFVDDAGVIIHNGDTLPGWAGTDIPAIVSAAAGLERTQVACNNDVRTWAYGEHRIGAGRSAADLDSGRVLYVSLGTGVGGALVSDGALVSGPTGSAGEISELVCADYRGIADRAENIASGNSLARYYNELSRRGEADRAAGHIEWRDWQPGDVRLPEVLEKMRGGDELARDIVAGNLTGFGRCLGGLVSGFDLTAIVLGGGVVGIGEEITSPLVAGIRAAALPPNQDVSVLTSAFTAHAPLVAAACFARETAGTTTRAGRVPHRAERD